MLRTKRGLARGSRDKATEATAAEEGGTCFPGGSGHRESPAVGREEAHSRKGPDTTPTILFTFSLTTKIALGRK